ncbi:tRNA-specific adenosine deaminase [bioreactor metagenome]|uniref:tRNA-specific adenosine deaminase n=1 Tax=bioreactor metagenome TaxID=1076179 RepID=A0A644ZT51_9ZZZZ
MAEGENQIHTAHDPTFHAELGLIRRFCAESGITDLSDYTLYSSCEPCFMCSGSLVWARLGRLVYGASDRDYCSIRGFMPNECSALVFRLSPLAPRVEAGMLREEAMEVLQAYFG